jgi:hypothetical protein
MSGLTRHAQVDTGGQIPSWALRCGDSRPSEGKRRLDFRP